MTSATFRRAHALVARWERERFVLDNYLTGSSVELTPALIQFVEVHSGPARRSELRSALSSIDPEGRLVDRLIDHDVYLAEGSEAAARDGLLDDTWIWGQAARWFHFATRNTPFEPDLDRQRKWLSELAAAVPPPPPLREDDGPHIDLPPAGPLDSVALGGALAERRTTRHWSTDAAQNRQPRYFARLDLGHPALRG